MKKVLEDYNQFVKDNGLKKNEVVTILKPTKKAIEEWYGKKNVARYLEEYGMDLVGEAQRAGFAFGVPKKSMVLDDFVKNGGFGYRVDKAQGGRVGHKEGGLVKLNPADYIEYYSDGTKLYKINSFIRDIARQIA